MIYLLKMSSKENFIFCVVCPLTAKKYFFGKRNRVQLISSIMYSRLTGIKTGSRFFSYHRTGNERVFFILSVFFPDGSQDSRGREGTIFYPLYHFHPLTNIQTFVCNFARRWLSLIFNCTAGIYQTATRWDLTPYRITIWSIDDMLIFVRLFDDLILNFDAAI